MKIFKKKNLKFVLLLLLLTGNIFNLLANDNGKDSLSSISKKRANKTALLSAIIPGLGQIYNKKYWKVPVIYGGTTALIYFISENNKEYKKYKEAILYRSDSDTTTVDVFPRYTNEDLSVRKNYYRRNRDFCYIFAGLLYTLNILDAYVDSQLMNFDISDNLSLHSWGTINYSQYGLPVVSLQLVLTLK